MLYLTVKALHIIFVIAWIAAMLIYPRYKLHPVKSVAGEPLFETMKEACQRLRRIILTPAMLLVWGLGITMIWLNPALLQSGWLHVKLLLVLGLSGLHGYFIGLGRKIDAGQEVPAKTLKLLNELPFILAIIIVFLAVLRPF